MDSEDTEEGSIRSHEEHNDNPVQEETPPPDGGWGWMVTMGAFVIMIVNQMLGPSFGIMFSDLLTSLQVSSVTVAWIFNIQAVMWNISQLFAPPLCDVFGWRKVGIFGAVLAAMSISVSAFATSAQFLFFSFSFLSGFGGGLDTSVCFFIVPSYFKRRRGAAMALMSSGVCIGQFLGPILITYLQDFYGFSGATLILGGIFLHSVVGASLFRPVTRYSKKSIELEETKLRRKNVSPETGSHEVLPLKDFPGDVKGETDTKGENSLAKKGSRTLSTVGNIFRKVCKSTKHNLKMVKSYRAIIIGLGTSLTFNAYFNFNMQIPFILQSRGYSLTDSAFYVSFSAICNMVSRLFILFATDFKICNKICWYLTGTLLLAAGSFGFVLMSTNKTLLLVFIALIGFGIGANMGLYSLVIIEVMGIKDYPSTFGITSLFIGFGALTIGPVAGFIRDVKKSYEASMMFLSGIVFCSLVLWAFMPLAIKHDKKKNTILS